MNRASSAFRLPIIVVLFASAVLFSNLGGPRLWDRDEPRNAGCAREMLARGDWVTPVFNGELRNHKPVLLYWLIMTAYAVFGVSEFAARFWSALAGTATVLTTYGIGSHLFGKRSGLWAGMALATSLMFQVAARAATPDALLIFFTTLGFYFFARWSLPAHDSVPDANRKSFPCSITHAAFIYGSFACGVLAKGPIALVLPTAILGTYMLVAHRQTDLLRNKNFAQRIRRWPGYFLWTCWRMRPITALAMLLAIAVPWYVWVGLRTDGKFLWDFFIEHNLHRAQRPMEGHDGPVFYYLIAALPGFFPWSVFLAPTIGNAISVFLRRQSVAPAVTFCCAWIVVWITAFSLASTKLPSYITPCYPAMALLTGFFLDRWVAGRAEIAPVWPRLAIATLGLVGIVMLVALPLVARAYLPKEQWLAVIGLIPLAGAIACGLLIQRERRSAAVISLVTTAAFLGVALFAVAADRVDRYQQSDRLLQVVTNRGAKAELGAFGCLEPSWVFYADRRVQELADLNQYLHGRDERLVITTRRKLAELSGTLPSGVQVLAEAPYFLKDEQLVLVGYPDHVLTARR